MKITLISFADSRLAISADRFRKEAEEFNVFEEISVKSEKDFTSSFLQKFEQYLKPGVRGFGYWVWKPWLIKQELENLEENEILVYADVGFSINPNGISRFFEYINRVKQSETGVLGFQAKRPETDGPVIDDGRSLPEWREKYWTKGDLFDYFNVRSSPEIVDTPTIQAGLIFFRKCYSSLSFVEEWMNVFKTHFELVDDSPSKSPNFSGFREHRHDQPVFSILGKLHGIDTVSSNEFWMPRWWSSIPDWKALEKTPFHATRNLDFGGTTKRTGANSDIASRLNVGSIRINLVLFSKRLSNLFKPVSQRYL